ncbi:hypothetical protein PGT21_021925 [Puccinia graminis f. sp. tritici]|uniref:Uncharacterized protein n=1 Tax=Puccinia graminis f. sp. tritici TaxID=56615 RepID=A0A5B0NBG4_PUCGR|nr:hypothetical protein PGT21_021925 [Puccinia graminis f. sp. tritici]KAA1090382.1 hypothetical protein PGTUg99_005440 [Puccinia graminis f. sp. tritici]
MDYCTKTAHKRKEKTKKWKRRGGGEVHTKYEEARKKRGGLEKRILFICSSKGRRDCKMKWHKGISKIMNVYMTQKQKKKTPRKKRGRTERKKNCSASTSLTHQ